MPGPFIECFPIISEGRPSKTMLDRTAYYLCLSVFNLKLVAELRLLRMDKSHASLKTEAS
jgi:hypothetical protein